MAQSKLEELEEEKTKLAKLNRENKDRAEEAETALTRVQNQLTAHQKAGQRQLAIDMGGGMTAQVGVELINWLIRIAADHFPDSWVARNADLLQSIPHVVIGSALYVTEMVLRDPKKAPSGWNQYGAMVGLIWQQLGLNALYNAIRMRVGDGRETRETQNAQLEAAKAEIAALKKRLGG